jgi:hypothetical protein
MSIISRGKKIMMRNITMVERFMTQTSVRAFSTILSYRYPDETGRNNPGT